MAPPRAAFIDYPLGHTAGRRDDPADQRDIVLAALDLLDSATSPGTIVDLGRRWGEERWKRHPLSSGRSGRDGRRARTPEPVYQNEEDRELAILGHGDGDSCADCVGASLRGA